MRHVASYDNFIRERFQRCLDLYLCPRVKKKKLNIDPDSLIPKLPDPKLMRPFPTARNIEYFGHTEPILAIAVSPEGTYLATGDQGGKLVIWETLTGRAYKTLQFEEEVLAISWSKQNMIAFSHGSRVELLLWKYPKKLAEEAQANMEQCTESDKIKNHWNFYPVESAEYRQGLRIWFTFSSSVEQIEFEPTKGDYFLTVCQSNPKKNEIISIHRISQAASETNFLQGKGIFKQAYFYPKKPRIIILTQSKVVLYNLDELCIHKKLASGFNELECMAVHPFGGYIMAGGSNNKVRVGLFSWCASMMT